MLHYADDTVLLLGESNWQNLWSIKAIMRGFELIFGLKVNFSKSKLFGLKTRMQFLESKSIFLSCSLDKLPFTFLGIPVGSNLRRATSWKGIIDKLKRNLASWKE